MTRNSPQNSETGDHLLGFGLAVFLTAIPFGLVWFQTLAKDITIIVIAICAIVQIIVHMWFFLGIRPSAHSPWKLVSLLFAATVMFIMIGGTIWIMTNLAWRMGH